MIQGATHSTFFGLGLYVYLNPGFLCIEGRPLGWDGGFGKLLHLGNGCNLINWQDLGSEYQGISWLRKFRLIPILAGGPLFLVEGLS